MRVLLPMIALLAVLGAACSGTDETTDVTTDVTADATADAGADVSADVDADVSADVAAIDPADCQEAAEALTAIPAALPQVLGGTADTAALAAQAQALGDLEVPAEYEADFQVVADAYGEVATTLGSITLEPGQVPDAETQAALTELGTSLSSAEVSAASANVAEYFTSGCPQ